MVSSTVPGTSGLVRGSSFPLMGPKYGSWARARSRRLPAGPAAGPPRRADRSAGRVPVRPPMVGGVPSCAAAAAVLRAGRDRGRSRTRVRENPLDLPEHG
ncbi:hypothetical protein Slala02_52470 [Streptomyces lavendulae subsp. lavendulae]|nr:hypothetical protein Slala01_05640 [Streptomyces lavendulae subsp. lavendulae]GLX29427.1 hypothetical protein Slala02_52470 [Streptomyces lavendulae subsp. lavendulae]